MSASDDADDADDAGASGDDPAAGATGAEREHGDDVAGAGAGEPERPAWGPGRAPGTGHLAIAVDTTVVEERGRWFVELVVVFTDEAVRRRIGDYRSRRQAEIAAQWIRRGAERDIDGPLHG